MKSPAVAYKKFLSATTHTPSTLRARYANKCVLTIEQLEDRRMLSGFQRVDAVPGTDLYTSAQAYNYASDSRLSPQVQETVPSLFADSGDDPISHSAAGGPLTWGASMASSIGQSLSQVPTEINGFTQLPTVNMGTQELSSVTYFNSDDHYGGALSGVETSSLLNARFVYTDDTPLTADDLFVGIQYVGAGGGVSTAPYSHWNHGSLMDFQVWLNGTLIIEVAAVGEGGGGFGSPTGPEGTPGSTEWGYTVYVNGVDTYDGGGTQLNAFIGANVAIGNGSTITFIGSICSDSSAEQSSWPDLEGYQTTQSVFGEAINAFCGVIASGAAPPTGLTASFAAPADFNSDGVTNDADATIWAQDIGNQVAGTRSMLLVTTENDSVNGDTSYFDLSLREALAMAGDSSHPGTDKIVFAPWVHNITLAYHAGAGTRPDSFWASNVDVLGPGADKLTIDGGGHNTVFNASNATFEGITVTGGGGATGRGGAVGGGIIGQNITVRESRITGNTSLGNGGGIYSNIGNLHIIDSEISGNVASGSGGGLWLRTTTGPYEIAIVNSTISGNQAAVNGGGVFNYEVQYGDGLSFNITNSTISDNTAANGGGVYNYLYIRYEDPFPAPRINNTIIAGNRNSSAVANDVDGGAFDSSSSYNLIGYDPEGLVPSGNGNIRGTTFAIDPRLAPLDFYGGTTKTHALLYDSLAIDAGDNDFVAEFELAFDQRGDGYDRIVDWGIDDCVDIGAFELAVNEIYGV